MTNAAGACSPPFCPWSEARAAGRGGIAAVSEITGLARSTIGRGLKDLDDPPPGKVRRPGGGARKLTDHNPGLLDDLRHLVEPVTLGDPERPLLWVSKSLAKLAAALRDMGHRISPNSVGTLLTRLGFSRQTNRKADEGSRHPDRDARFEHISTKVRAAQGAGEPVISVDTKKKELIGNDKNGGTDYRPKAEPRKPKHKRQRAWPDEMKSGQAPQNGLAARYPMSRVVFCWPLGLDSRGPITEAIQKQTADMFGNLLDNHDPNVSNWL